ncbi:MAG: FkbM family methyltransferase [Rhodocyclaceae bacterium]|nr:FkbM family methyltransferase [Rhodocyclaceae bacterium]
MKQQSSIEESWSEAIAAADALRDAGDFADAIAQYRSIISEHPTLAMAHYKLGTAYMRMTKSVEAEACFRHALRLKPDFPSAKNNLGILRMNQGDAAQAEVYFRDVLASDVNHFEAHLNLGNLLRDLSRATEAVYFYKRAIALDPGSARALERLGDMLIAVGETSEAKKLLQEAVAIDITLFDAWVNLGRCYVAFGELEAAQNCCRKAIACGDTDRAPWHNLLLSYNWLGHDKTEAYKNHLAFGEHLTKTLGSNVAVAFKNSRDANRKLRIGFVSGDIRRHSVSYFIEGPLSNLETEQFELFAYNTYSKTDYRADQLMAIFSTWRNVFGIDTKKLTQLIRRDQIDILFDLSGHTGHNRLDVFASKAAPIQVSWIGYPNTTGLSAMDYRITDEIADPLGEADSFYCEKLVRFPSSFLCYAPPVEAPDLIVPAASANGQITFGSFNARVKISDQTLRLWARVLDSLPTARLVVKSVAGMGDEGGRSGMIAQAQRAGIDPARITLLPRAPTLEEHLSAYAEIDVCLDTTPYNGTTTTCEALWMGVPVVTLAGDRHAARVGASLLTNAGLSELVATSSDEFVRIAIELANDNEHRFQLRASLRERMRNSPLMDARSSAMALSQAMRDMWIAYCEQPIGARPETASASSPDFQLVVLGGHKVFVEADPFHSLTSWVLLEQEDWFEGELRFLRQICTPSWNVLDIGSSYGLYSLALARCGVRKIWAVDAAPEPMEMLRRSVEANGFGSQIELLPLALSDRSATISKNAGGQKLHVTTLDEVAKSSFQTETGMDFIKLDADGDELAILDGGVDFFRKNSPLVLFNCGNGRIDFRAKLISKFRAMDFGIYRLVAVLNVLVNVSPEQEGALDPFTLNLFACPAEKAAELATAGLIVSTPSTQAVAVDPKWIDVLLSLPAYSTTSRETWSDTDPDSAYMRAVFAWCGSQRLDLSADLRLQLLYTGLNLVQSAVAAGDSHPAVAAIGLRLCADIGLRAQALEISGAFLEQMSSADDFPLDRPLPPSHTAFDQRTPVKSLGNFLYQSIVEFALDNRHHSSFFTPNAMPDFSASLANPEHSARLERTAVLCHARAGTPLTIAADAKIFALATDNLNPSIWRGIATAGSWLNLRGEVAWEALPLVTHDREAQSTAAARLVSEMGRGSQSAAREEGKQLRLHVGGIQAKNGWKILNALPGPDVDFVGDVRDLSAFSDQSCAEIYCSHILEHISQNDIVPTLRELHRLLVSGGRLMISVPDLAVLCEHFLDPELSGQQRFHVMRMMFGGQMDAYDFHQIGLTAEFLAEYLLAAGFSGAEQVDGFDLFDDTSTYAPFGRAISLNVVATK